MSKVYAGIGSRQTPPEVLELMGRIAVAFSGTGWLLRSGGAEGADSAFETHHDGLKEIYIPWNGFNQRYRPKAIVATDLINWPQARELARLTHPAWNRLGQGAQKLHGRNTYQILGHTLEDPVSVVICYTPGGKGGGGTGQALRIAQRYNCEIRDLGDPAVYGRALLAFG